jgi:hypothetical protein
MRNLLLLTFISLNAWGFSKKLPGTDKADAGSLVWVPNLKEQKQERSQWCWAASGRLIVSAKIEKLPSQCEIVSKVKKLDCCKNNSVKCNQPAFVDEAAIAYGIKAKVDLSPTFKEVVDQVKSGKAVGIAHSWRSGTAENSGHEVVAIGTYKVNGKEYIAVYDPLIGATKAMDSSYVVGNLAWHQLISLEN